MRERRRLACGSRAGPFRVSSILQDSSDGPGLLLRDVPGLRPELAGVDAEACTGAELHGWAQHERQQTPSQAQAHAARTASTISCGRLRAPSPRALPGATARGPRRCLAYDLPTMPRVLDPLVQVWREQGRLGHVSERGAGRLGRPW